MNTFKYILILICIWLLPIQLLGIELIEYSHAGNYKALISFPNTMTPTSNEKFPVIIFSYDEYVDLLGQDVAKTIGYDLEHFMKMFNQWGFACIIPLERHRKLNALKGAIFSIRKTKSLNKDKIILVGASEGALLSLLAVHNTPQVSGIVIIDPVGIHKKGHLSYPNLVRQMDAINVPILFIASKTNKRWRNKRSDLLRQLFIDHNKTLVYKEYNFKKKWFWNPEYQFMDDIETFTKNL